MQVRLRAVLLRMTSDTLDFAVNTLVAMRAAAQQTALRAAIAAELPRAAAQAVMALMAKQIQAAACKAGS